MVKGNDVIGLKVITLSTGKEIDTVNDVVYDPSIHEVRAFLLDTGGWFSDAKVILTVDVHSIGKDAVIIENEEMVKKASEVIEPIATIAQDSQFLTKTKIITEGGTDLGQISDILFDEKTGKVFEFEVSQGMLKNLQSGTKRIRVADIITIGEDATIVKSYTEENFEEQAQEQGIQGALNKGKDTVQSGVDTTRERTPSFIDQMKTKTQELSDKAETKTQELREHPKTQELQKNLQKQTKKAKKSMKKGVRNTKAKTQEVRDNHNTQDIFDALKLQAEKSKDQIKKQTDKAQEKIRHQAEEQRASKHQEQNNNETVVVEREVVVEGYEEVPNPVTTQYQPYGTLGGKVSRSTSEDHQEEKDK